MHTKSAYKNDCDVREIASNRLVVKERGTDRTQYGAFRGTGFLPGKREKKKIRKKRQTWYSTAAVLWHEESRGCEPHLAAAIWRQVQEGKKRSGLGKRKARRGTSGWGQRQFGTCRISRTKETRTQPLERWVLIGDRPVKRKKTGSGVLREDDFVRRDRA